MAKEEDKSVEISQKEKMTAKAIAILKVHQKYRIARFLGGVWYSSEDGWRKLNQTDFSAIAYDSLGMGVDKSRIADIWHYFETNAEDLSKFSKYIGLSDGTVLDRDSLEFTTEVAHEDCIYSSPYTPKKGDAHKKFFRDVANGSDELARDIVQSIAAIIPVKKPVGVIWFTGEGGNGKSSVLESVYKLLPGFFSTLSLSEIENGRNAPTMLGRIANVCRETEYDVIITGTKNYKLMGSHEPYEVNRMFSQDPYTIPSNLHYIFNANKIPTFADKGNSIRRRTITIPFTAFFEEDETFNERTFTKVFMDNFFYDLLELAREIKANNYKYTWSEVTKKAKDKYDKGANTAHTYIQERMEGGMVGFVNYKKLRWDYENWCDEAGYTPLGRKSLALAAEAVGFEPRSVRTNEGVYKRYFIDGASINNSILKTSGLYITRDGELLEIKEDDTLQLALGELMEELK